MSHPFMRTSTNNSKLFDSFIITIWSNSQCNQWKYHFLTFRWNPFSIIFYQMGASIFHPINAGCDRERWIILSTGMEIFIEKGKKENLVVINYWSPAHRSVGRWERNRKAEAVEKYNIISVVVPIMLYLCGAHRHTQTHKWALNWGKREREKKQNENVMDFPPPSTHQVLYTKSYLYWWCSGNWYRVWCLLSLVLPWSLLTVDCILLLCCVYFSDMSSTHWRTSIAMCYGENQHWRQR